MRWSIKKIVVTVIILTICVSIIPLNINGEQTETKINLKKAVLKCNGDTLQLKVSGKNISSDGKRVTYKWNHPVSGKRVTGYSKIIWSSSDSDVVKVSSTGKIVSKNAGKATIYAKGKYGNQRTFLIKTCEVTVKHTGKATLIKRTNPSKWSHIGKETRKCSNCGNLLKDKKIYYKANEEDVAKELDFLLNYFASEPREWLYGRTTYKWAIKELTKDGYLDPERELHTIWDGDNQGVCVDWADLCIAYTSGSGGMELIVLDGKYCKDIDGHKKGDIFYHSKDLRAGDIIESFSLDHAEAFIRYTTNEELELERGDFALEDGTDADVIYLPHTNVIANISSNGRLEIGDVVLNPGVKSNKNLRKATSAEVDKIFDDVVKKYLSLDFVDEVRVESENGDIINVYDKSYAPSTGPQIPMDMERYYDDLEACESEEDDEDWVFDEFNYLIQPSDCKFFYGGHRSGGNQPSYVRLNDPNQFNFYYYDPSIPVRCYDYTTVYRLSSLIDK